jgi:hypothetical protein
MVTGITLNHICRPRSEPCAAGFDPPCCVSKPVHRPLEHDQESERDRSSPQLNLLILIEIEHVQYVTLAVDQQYPPAIDDAFQIIS